MKIQKSKTLLLSLILSLTLNVAQAQVFGGIFGKKNKSSSSTTEKLLEVNNSLFNLEGSTAPDDKWMFIIIQKDNYREELLLPIENGRYQTTISLQAGAGIYDIDIRLTKNPNKITKYAFFKKVLVENLDSRDMSFLLPTFKVQSDDSRIIALVKEITQNARDDEEAFRAIYKFVTAQIKYDYESYKDNSYAQKDYNAVNTLINSMAVCEGYANLVAAMSRAYGIRAKVVVGLGQTSKVSGHHAWNEVFIHDEWKFVDATWDAVYKHQPYLFMEGEKFATEHIKERETTF